jgi:hypothetical protein
MTIDDIETAYSVRLPKRHRTAILDAADPIHQACEFLVIDGPGVLLPIHKTNTFLRTQQIEEWPNFLFAFASNGVGDYFAYDTRRSPYKIVYIDPDLYMDENLAHKEGDLKFDSFVDWHSYKCQQYEADVKSKRLGDA